MSSIVGTGSVFASCSKSLRCSAVRCFGTTTRTYLDRALSDTLLLRWANLGKYTEETIGLEWFTQFTLFQSLNERTGLAWQWQTEGETDNEVQLTRHTARLILRRQLTPDWLFSIWMSAPVL